MDYSVWIVGRHREGTLLSGGDKEPNTIQEGVDTRNQRDDRHGAQAPTRWENTASDHAQDRSASSEPNRGVNDSVRIAKGESNVGTGQGRWAGGLFRGVIDTKRQQTTSGP